MLTNKFFITLFGFIFSAFFMSLFVTSTVTALKVPDAPKLTSPIVDKANVLSISEYKTLTEKINNLHKEKSLELGILIISSLEDESLEGYSLKVARKWGIGEKDKSNGALILIAIKEHKIRIEVGRGLEEFITDAEAGRIIRNLMAPEFQKSHYASGISLALDEIEAQTENRTTIKNNDRKKDISTYKGIISILIISFAAISYLGSLLAKSKSWWAGGIIGLVTGVITAIVLSWTFISFILLAVLTGLGFAFDYFVSKNYREAKKQGKEPSWWAGGGWGGSSGGSGGGSSFGGGGFSGGGASGGW